MNSSARSRMDAASIGGRRTGQAPWGHSLRPAGNCATGHVFRVSLQVPADAGSGSARAGFFERIACDLVSADSPAAGEPAVRSAKHVF